jgi:RNA polymerase sigma-70 factor, ECF subfamily
MKIQITSLESRRIERVASGDASPEWAAIEQEAATSFDNALTKLSEDDRRVVLLRRIEGYTNQQVAKLLEITPQAASMRYLRAIRRLKELMVNPDSVGDPA